MDLVRRLEGTVGFFKIGWQLFMSGELRSLLHQLEAMRVFVDLKVPGDIGNTIRAVVGGCVAAGNVEMLTLSDSVPGAAIRSATEARGSSPYPKLLTVPLLSSLDASDVLPASGSKGLDDYILGRADRALRAGCDGLIASGQAIELLRRRYPSRSVLIVSPGIRPAGSASDDHKRLATPAEAIRMGADYLVVGRPIRSAPDPERAARMIIDEIDRALAEPACADPSTGPGRQSESAAGAGD
jgi:orotidine-5'-phosphate decarboxylase